MCVLLLQVLCKNQRVFAEVSITSCPFSLSNSRGLFLVEQIKILAIFLNSRDLTHTKYSLSVSSSSSSLRLLLLLSVCCNFKISFSLVDFCWQTTPTITTMTGDFLLLLLLLPDLLFFFLLDLTPTSAGSGAARAATVLLGGVLILCGVRLVRGGRRAGLFRVAHLHRVDDRRRRGVVRVRRADVRRTDL